MGCIVSISGINPFRDPNRGEKTLRKIEIENLNGNIIELTLWDEMAEHFRQADLEKMEQPAIRFTAEVTIKSINTKREWFYESCHQCIRTAIKQANKYTCLDHGPQPGPFFKYKFKAYITDTSGTTSLTFFTPAADKIKGHSYDVFSINTSGEGTSLLTTLPGTAHLITDKECPEEAEETSISKEVTIGTPIPNPSTSTTTGKSQEEDDISHEKSSKRCLILEPSAETKKPKGY
ncbi:DNA helicase [Tanacetum coccineum]|uniref:DNA helicase n=1 Tax=Tanacetum coccineum TaxID=301880 RepID=A0ABQ5DJM2_9ASTR